MILVLFNEGVDALGWVLDAGHFSEEVLNTIDVGLLHDGPDVSEISREEEGLLLESLDDCDTPLVAVVDQTQALSVLGHQGVQVSLHLLLLRVIKVVLVKIELQTILTISSLDILNRRPRFDSVNDTQLHLHSVVVGLDLDIRTF